jgi:hypothetical protein
MNVLSSTHSHRSAAAVTSPAPYSSDYFHFLEPEASPFVFTKFRKSALSVLAQGRVHLLNPNPPPFQITLRFDTIRFIDAIMDLDVHYVLTITPSVTELLVSNGLRSAALLRPPCKDLCLIQLRTKHSFKHRQYYDLCKGHMWEYSSLRCIILLQQTNRDVAA